jgi:hypothetical protein
LSIHITIEDARAEGRAEAEPQGILNGRIFQCRRMLGQSPTSMSELDAMTIEELDQLIEQLEQVAITHFS